jgi:hypothetical protein
MNIVHERFSNYKTTKTLPQLSFCAKNFIYICPAFKYHVLTQYGALAQLARVLDWQSRGHRFDSGMLHLIIKILQRCKVFFYGLIINCFTIRDYPGTR